MNIVVAGGAGFIRSALIPELLNDGHRVTLLTRDPGRTLLQHSRLHIVQWNPPEDTDWHPCLDGADAVINLAGELLAGKRWSAKQKMQLVQSRIQPAAALVHAIRAARRKPAVLVSASGVGYYGDVPEGDVDESAPAGNGFLADLCRRWEETALRASDDGVRVVLLRMGVVLSRDGGALPRMMAPFKMFVGGYLGSGKQWFPWIHRDDVVKAIGFVLKETSISGPVNLVAPDAVTMKTFCSTLGQEMHSPSWIFIPGFALRILLGEMADMLTTGQRAIPLRLTERNFTFSYPTLSGALHQIFQRPE